MAKTIEEKAKKYALSQVLSCTDTKMTQQAYLSIRMFNGYDVACGYKDGANAVLEQIEQLIYEKHVKGNLPLFDLTYLIDKLKDE